MPAFAAREEFAKSYFDLLHWDHMALVNVAEYFWVVVFPWSTSRLLLGWKIGGLDKRKRNIMQMALQYLFCCI